jgi:hypothetical protein
VQHLSQLLYSEKREELLKEHNVTKPSFYFGHFKCGKVMNENIMNINNKVIDKFASHKERIMDLLDK